MPDTRSADSRSKIEKLRAMAAQTDSPVESEAAKRRLEAMGVPLVDPNAKVVEAPPDPRRVHSPFPSGVEVRFRGMRLDDPLVLTHVPGPFGDDS